MRAPEQAHTILLVSDDADLCAAARREFEERKGGLRVTSVGSIDAARRIVEDASPAVILLEQTSLQLNGDGPASCKPLNSAVSALAVYAPVVVIGAEQQQTEVAALVAAGAADFVARGNGALSVALGLVERRLRQGQRLAEQTTHVPHAQAPEHFGELLRHELNNPLTGILGNAELLLAEIRRDRDGRMPQGSQQRLETIAALAVRLRETVRRLSQEWETKQNAASP